MQHGARGSNLDKIADNGGMPVDEQAEPVAARAWWEENGDLWLHGGVPTCSPSSCVEPQEHSVVGGVSGGCLNHLWHQRDHMGPPFARCCQQVSDAPPWNLITEFAQRHLHTHAQILIPTIVTDREKAGVRHST